MKTYLIIPLLFTLLPLAFSASGQHIKVSPGGGKVMITYDTNGYHKTMYVLRGPDSSCGDIVGYDPDVHTGKKDNKYTGLDFKAESSIVGKLLGVASDYRQHKLCTWMISILAYNDLLLKQVDAFAASKEWQDYLKTYKGGPYNMQLITSIMTKADVLQSLDSLLQPLGYHIVSLFVPQEIKEVIPPDILTGLKKDKKLVIPQVDPLWVELMHQ